MSISVGSVSVEVLPDARGFDEKLNAAIRNAQVRVQAVLDDKGVRAQIDGLSRGAKARIEATVDGARAKSDLDALARSRSATVRVNADTGAAQAKVKALGASADGASKGMGALVTAALALSPAIVPIAGAATAAIAGLSVPLAAAGASVGAFAVFAVPLFKQVGDAMKGLATAQKAVTSATSGPQYLAALAKQKKALDAMPPSIRTAVTSIDQLRGHYQTLQRGLAPQIFGVFNAGIQAANNGLPLLATLAGAASGPLRSMLAALGDALKSAPVHSFVSFLAREAGPAIFTFSRSLGNIGSGFAGLLQAFAPVAKQVENGLLGVSKAFASFGQGASKSKGFQSFLTYIENAGPQIANFVGDAARAIGNLVKALAPLGPPMVYGLDLLAKVIANIPPPLLAGIAAGILAIKLASNHGGAGFGGMAAGVKTLLTSLTSGGGGLKGALSGVTAILGGPWGIGIAAAAGALTFFASKHQAAAAAEASIQGSLNATTGALTSNTNEVIANQLAQDGSLRIARQYGLSLALVTASAEGSTTASRTLAGQMATISQKGTVAGVAMQILGGHLGDLTGQTSEAQKHQKLMGDATNSAAIALAKGGHAAKAAGPLYAIAGTKVTSLTTATQLLNTAIDVLLGRFLSVPEALSAENSAIAAVTKKVLNHAGALTKDRAAVNLNTAAGRALFAVLDTATRSTYAAGKAVFDHEVKTKGLRKATQDANGAFDHGIGVLRNNMRAAGLNKAQQDKLFASLGLTKDAFSKLITKADGSRFSFDKHSTATKTAADRLHFFRGKADSARGGVDLLHGRMDASRGALDKHRSAAQAAADKLHFFRGKADEARGGVDLLRGSIGKLTDKKVKVTVLTDIAHTKSLYTATNYLGISKQLGFAAGGGPVAGPGTGTSDTAGLYALSNGEHILTAAEVEAAGGHGAITALRRLLLQQGHGRAAGGAILDPRLGLQSRGRPFGTEASGLNALLAALARRIDTGDTAKINAALLAKVTSRLKSVGAGAGSPGYKASAGASQWSSTVLAVLRALHQSTGWLGATLRRMTFESGGNPRAINLTDSNARAGHPSKGLMQTIQGTFNAYAGPYRGRGIYDPFANIYAGLNYAVHRYGSIGAVDPRVRHKGYDQGGWLKPGTTVVHNTSGHPEPVLNPLQWTAIERLAANSTAAREGGVTFNGDVHTMSVDELVRKVEIKQQMARAQHPMFGFQW
jgi:SLT domain-containing protein